LSAIVEIQRSATLQSGVIVLAEETTLFGIGVSPNILEGVVDIFISGLNDHSGLVEFESVDSNGVSLITQIEEQISINFTLVSTQETLVAVSSIGTFGTVGKRNENTL